MTITNAEELEGLRVIGRIVADTLQGMSRAMEPGMTTRELDTIGRRMLEAAGAQSAPEVTYGFPGATCISVNDEIAHGVPGDRVLAVGDLVNIDVSACRGGYFADTGASFALGELAPKVDRLRRDGRRAMEVGIAAVRHGRPLSGIGAAVGRFAASRGYTLIRNLASHGIGRALHEAPEEIATWPNADRRRVHRGLVLTVEPFLSLGGQWAETGRDGWTLQARPRAMAVQFEHTVVATDRSAIVLTLPGPR
jgi:methionyl aminopeptidase